MKVSVAILGASGYAGQELVRILARHPHARIRVLAAQRSAGCDLAQLYPALPDLDGHPGTLLPLDPLPDLRGIDCAFFALPHGSSAAAVAAALDAGCRVIDLGADFRLRDPALYAEWYGFSHPQPGLLAEAVYGLPEWQALRARSNGAGPGAHPVASARLVAVPGCYPTGALVGLLPLAAAGLIDPGSVVIDSKSGTSGAGRSPGDALSFSEVYENVRAYGVARHRHIPEMEQELSLAAGCPVRVSFTPHLVPMARGILTTAYASLRPGAGEAEVAHAFAEAYRGAPFVRFAPKGVQPETKWARGSNRVYLQWVVDPRTGRVVVTTALDNLGKGAAGQAVQCFNLMFGFPETTGLEQGGIAP